MFREARRFSVEQIFIRTFASRDFGTYIRIIRIPSHRDFPSKIYFPEWIPAKQHYFCNMNLEELREYCISKNGVEETTPFGPETLVFKVIGKAFLLTGFENNPVQFNVKCDPEKAIDLRERYACVRPGYHMNKKHWNTVVADGSVKIQLVKEWIDHSYDLVVAGLPKIEREKLSRKKK